MPAPKLLAGLPKPLLFGLYGALGGLLGGLVFGEILWAFLQPPPPPPRFAISVSPQVSVYPGTQNTIEVHIARDRFHGPVQVSFQHMSGVSIAPITIPEGESAASVEIVAADDAAVGTVIVDVLAVSEDRELRHTSQVEVSVILPPPQLAFTVSPQVSVYPGTQNTMEVQLARDRFDGPVQVSFEAVSGLKIDSITIPQGETAARVDVHASKEAAIGAVKVDVVAMSADPELREVAQVEVTVIPLPPVPRQLAVSISPDIKVYQRGKNQFSVQVARRGFDGDVRVEFRNLPADVTADTITLPFGITEATTELFAGRDSPLGRFQINAIAYASPARNAVDRDEVTARSTASLEVVESLMTQVDIVFALDISGSMQWAIEGTSRGIQKFAEALGKNQFDARVGLVGFRDTTLFQPLVELKFGGEKLTSDFAVFGREVASLNANAGGPDGESSLDGIAAAADYSFRPQATKVIIMVTDEGPKRPDKRMKSVDATALHVKQKKIDQLHIVTLPELERKFKALAAGAPGKVFNLRDVQQASDGFDKLLPDLSRAIADLVADKPTGELELADALPPKLPDIAEVELSPLPVIMPPVAEVKLSNMPMIDAPPPLRGVQSTATYDPSKKSRLVAAVGVWTGAISAWVCLALVMGQHHYLRGGIPGIGSIIAGLGGGLVVGLAGGAAGQGLYLLAPENAVLGSLVRVLGWAMLGALAGTGLSFFVPNLRVLFGLLGGLIGGTAGAVAYIGAEAVANELVGRLAGGVALGFCVGVMVAFVEAAFRRAWLEVSYGSREKVTVNLGPEAVKVGGNARACTVWARGAPDIALRYFIRGGQVICNDVSRSSEFTVRDGDARAVGNLTVIVRNGAGSIPTTLPPSPPPPPPPSSPNAAPRAAARNASKSPPPPPPPPRAKPGP